MTVMQPVKLPSLRGRVDPAEWQARVDLAAAYRLAAHHGWTDLLNNHISLRVPGTTDQFLINPYGLLYEQVTASSLLKIDMNGKTLQDSPYPVNEAGFVIHSAIHMARPDLHCVWHTHTVAGQAVSALACGLLPLNQTALIFHKRIGYHDFEGIAEEDNLSERERIVRDLGPHRALVMRHHGLLTAGATVGDAFTHMYYLEKCCATQMQVLASGQPYSVIPEALCERTVRQLEAGLGQRHGPRPKAWPALLALVESLDPGFKE